MNVINRGIRYAGQCLDCKVTIEAKPSEVYWPNRGGSDINAEIKEKELPETGRVWCSECGAVVQMHRQKQPDPQPIEEPHFPIPDFMKPDLRPGL